MGGSYALHIVESQPQSFGLVNIAVGYTVKLVENMIGMLMRYANAIVGNALNENNCYQLPWKPV